jgi:molybdopterin-guanine dinucleotide biosynthesis protein A
MRHIVIMADGATKNFHFDGPRHFIEPHEGEPLLQRTVDQFSQYGIVFVVCNGEEPYASLKHCEVVVPVQRSEYYGEMDMMVKAIPFANAYDDTVIVLGDVYFEDGTVRDIMTRRPEWACFGRTAGNAKTRKPYAEYFAVYLKPPDLRRITPAAIVCAERRDHEIWHRATAWEWYWEMEGMLPQIVFGKRRLQVGEHWVEVGGWNDDFDRQVELDIWRTAWAEAHGE